MLVASSISLVGKNHQSIVVFGSKYTAYTLASLSHGVKRQEIVFTNVEVVFQEIHPGFQVARQSVLVWDAKDYHTTTIMASKIDPLRYFTSCNTEEYSSSAVVARLLIIFQSQFSLKVILSLNVYELVLKDLLQDLHVIPLHDHVLHILVAGEEAHDAIRHCLAQLNYKVTIVSDVSLILSFLELAGHCDLVIAFRHNHWADGISWELYVKGSHDFWRKV